MKKCFKIDYDLSGNNYYSVVNNRYLVFGFLKENKIIIVDFKKKNYKILDYMVAEENMNIDSMNDEKHLIISKDKERYRLL